MKKGWHFRKWVEFTLEIIMVLSFIIMCSIEPTLLGFVVAIIAGGTMYGCYRLLVRYGKDFQDIFNN